MSANLIWSIALAVIGITGLWLAGSQKRLGWALGLAAQALWVVFALITGQYGFIASAVAYGIVYTRNWRRAARPIKITLRGDTAQLSAAVADATATARKGCA